MDTNSQQRHEERQCREDGDEKPAVRLIIRPEFTRGRFQEHCQLQTENADGHQCRHQERSHEQRNRRVGLLPLLQLDRHDREHDERRSRQEHGRIAEAERHQNAEQ